MEGWIQASAVLGFLTEAVGLFSSTLLSPALNPFSSGVGEGGGKDHDGNHPRDAGDGRGPLSYGVLVLLRLS